MKITKWASALSLVVAVAIQGCALKPQNLHLDPEIDVTGDSVAVDTLIALSIRDGRSSKVLGEVAIRTTRTRKWWT